MSQRAFTRTTVLFAVVLSCLIGTRHVSPAFGQGGESITELKEKAAALMQQQKHTDALPLLEKIVAADPGDADMQFQLGFALIAQANTTRDESRKELRIRARKAFIKAKELGKTDPLVDALIHSLPPDGSDGKAFSPNPGANALMVEAESAFAQGKLDDALEAYQRALSLDPALYEAALFSADVYMNKDDFEKAETWYQKAIAINPNRETAYRYSATPLMKQQKYTEARDRYVEAYITEPYSRFAVAGLSQWGRVTETALAHPRIDIPTDITFDDKGDAKINLDAGVLLGGKDDGSFAWLAYGTSRSLWHKDKFARTFPSEKVYRHSLPEEVDALRSVISLATSDKKVKALSPSLAKLKKLNDEGLLEAYILMAQPDQGIAQDHPAYLKEHRDLLRRYVLTYVLKGGGE